MGEREKGLSLEQMRRELGVTAARVGCGPCSGEEASLSKSIAPVLRDGNDPSGEQSFPRSWEWLG